ncbi:chromosome transmission fidelity protein 1 [Pancytospora philotis]|nr:chromosome transmission fidelity protein 1 [Pancytospora philotis]
MEYGFDCDLYPSQRQLIADAVEIINNGQVGIVSSPTGTGKTISLLCTAVSFMKRRDSTEELYSLLETSSRTKIYYCSRTHSQLNQVLNELKRNRHRYSTVILGSRKQYCLNPRVSQIADINLLNEKCREQIVDECCEYYKNGTHYSEATLDIEDLKRAGRSGVFCPYYYTRNRAADCEIVLLPYNLLFSREGRRSLDISLDGKILIIDEAHNIYDTIIQTNSAELEWADVRRVAAAKGVTEQLATILRNLLSFQAGIKAEGITPVMRFLIDTHLADYNMFDVEEQITKDRLAQKNDMLVVHELARFLKLLTYSDDDGRVLYDRRRIRFTPLNPKMYFEELKKCRAVLFAGGTMEPIGHMQEIFPDLQYRCYPAVSSNFLSLIVSRTVSNRPVHLTYENRDALLDDVINTLVMLSNPVKCGGIVVFVPSKHILAMVRQSDKLQSFRRPVHFEDSVRIEDFKANPQILFAVMGGRLSEGINFSNDACRLLVVVGVPYPTATTELEERSKQCPGYSTVAAMKTVNQTLGRAIRHKLDYAAIVLLDARYAGLRAKLSPWIVKQTQSVTPVEGLVKINGFLKQNKLYT